MMYDYWITVQDRIYRDMWNFRGYHVRHRFLWLANRLVVGQPI